MNLLSEAASITNDIQEVVFVGSIAVFAHIGPHRQTSDIDFAIASTVSDERLLELGYKRFKESRKEVWYTPKGIKIDFYRKDVSAIPVSTVFRTAIPFKVGKSEAIRVMCLELLLVSKLRASRPQDIEDIQEIFRRKGKILRWELFSEIANEMEIKNLKTAASVFAK